MQILGLCRQKLYKVLRKLHQIDSVLPQLGLNCPQMVVLQCAGSVETIKISQESA